MALRYFADVKERFYVCGDAETAAAIVTNEHIRNALADLPKRGVHHRFITEITKDNIESCKELMKFSDMHHLEGVKVNFAVSEKAYLATATLQTSSSEPIIQLIHSNAKSVVQQHEYIFETLWNKSVPAEQKIREIEEGITSSKRTEVLYGAENAVGRGVQFMKNVQNKMDVYFDHRAPSIVTELAEYRNGYIDIRNRGGKIRCFTDITKKNLHYCKELMKLVDELRHLDGIKGGVAISETEFMATTVLQEAKPLTEVVYSNINGVVEQGQYIFDTLWSKAIPAEQRIREIEEGIPPEFVNVITDGKEAEHLISEFAKSVNKEAQLLLPFAKTMVRSNKLGIWDDLIHASKEKSAKIRVICPFSGDNAEIIKRISQDAPNIKILNGETAPVGMFIVDGQMFLRIEDREPDASTIADAIGIVIYSNSKNGTESFKSFFDLLWKQTELYENLKIHEQMQKDFINMVAHELRNPIQPILGLAEVLRYKMEKEDFYYDNNNEQQQDDRMRLLDAIIRNANRLVALQERILDIARIESKSLKLIEEEFVLNDIISQVVQDLSSKAQKKKIKIIVVEGGGGILNDMNDDNDNYNGRLNSINDNNENNAPLNIPIRGDKFRISQVLSNLLDNAIKFTQQGVITISAEIKHSQAVVRIKDTGSGLDASIIPRLFSKFASDSAGGTGVSLFISKNIIEAHGGRIWAENNKDGKGGATFTFTLPIARNVDSPV